ncbi:MAG: thioredoxin [Pseudohongiellaceae bacterium]
MTLAIKSQQEFNEALASNEWVLVDFLASWCGPCKSMAPIFDAVAQEHSDDLLAAKVDVDEHGEIAAQFNIRGVPTLALLHKGKQVAQLVGAQPKSALEKWIGEHKEAASD